MGERRRFVFTTVSTPLHGPDHLSPLMRTSNESRLFRLQLRIAQRADELARVSPSGGSARRDRETWRRAEAELLRGMAASGAGRRGPPVKTV